jgi:5'-3' exonuclease
VVEDYGFHPHNFILYRILDGDKSDNVPGVDGMGEKTILKYFPELAQEEYKEVEFLFEKAERLIAEKPKKAAPKVLQTLLASKSVVERNMSLMRLDDVAMSPNTRINIMNAFDRPPNKLNKLEFMEIANKHGFIRAFGHFDTWFHNSFVPLTRYILNDK